MKNRDGLKSIAFSDSIVEEIVTDDGRVLTLFCAPDKPEPPVETERDISWLGRIKKAIRIILVR